MDTIRSSFLIQKFQFETFEHSNGFQKLFILKNLTMTISFDWDFS